MWPSVRPVFAPFPPTSQLDVWSRKPDPLSPVLRGHVRPLPTMAQPTPPTVDDGG
jgi:hypothetical protein